MTTQRDALEGLLEICDQIRTLQDRAGRTSTDVVERKAQQMRERVRTIRENVFSAMPALRTQPGAGDLCDPELLILGLLFHCRVTGRESALDGSRLVAMLSQAGFSRTLALGLLDASATLLSGGWLRPEQRDNSVHFPLEVRFAASTAALDLFWPSVIADEPFTAEPESPPTPYRSEEECFWELYHWRNLCIQRASALFDTDRVDAQPSPRHRTLRREARSALVRVRARLAATPDSRNYQVERFRRDYRLGTDELLIVAHFLFAEMVEGEPYISALECLRMVAETRSDLFRKRRLVSAKGRLRREGILVASSDEYSKALATDLSLADWAAEEILAGMGRAPRLHDGELDDLLRGDGQD